MRRDLEVPRRSPTYSPRIDSLIPVYFSFDISLLPPPGNLGHHSISPSLRMCSPYTNQANNFVPRMAQNGHLKSSTSYSSPSIADTLRCGPIPEERWCHRRSAKKVSLQGKAIGMDGEGETLTSINDLRYPAKTNDTEHAELVHGNTEKAGACNVSFTEVSITFIPLPDSSTDCTISNCVLNPVPTPDKQSYVQLDIPLAETRMSCCYQ